MLIKFCGIVKRAALFAIKQPKEAAIILLMLLLAFLSWRLSNEVRNSQELAAKVEGLPQDTKQTITIYRDHVVTKWRDGPTRIEYRDRYLPPEGHIEIATKVDQPDKPPEIVIKDRGFTKRLGGGLVYSKELVPIVDFKWAYWQRYSLTTGITPRFGGIGISRHLDDLTPFQNLEILCTAGIDWNAKFRFGIGLRTNF